MASQLETIGGLERRLTLSVSPEDIAKRVQDRLRQISRTARLPGFRPGKVPMKMVEQSYGPQVQNEVFGDAVSAAFSSAVEEHKLRVAGQPRIEPAEAEEGQPPKIQAVFEVYPDVQLKDAAGVELARYECPVGDAEVDRTIEILRKQRTTFHDTDRASHDGDRLNIDFKGTLDGVAFDGGTAQGFDMVLGEGRMLPDFEKGLVGKSKGETTTFDVAFPQDYQATELAGKTAQFECTVNSVQEPKLPEVDDAFLRQMGVEEGGVEKFRTDVKANIEREVAQRLRQRTKAGVMDKLPEMADLEIPKALVEAESQQMADRMREDLKSRGMDVSKLPVTSDVFREQAEKRVRLGLIVAELVRANNLMAKPDQIRKQIEEFSQAYDNPAEVIRWYFSDRERLAEVEALVVEQNVVDWMLEKTNAGTKSLSFDELMAGAA